MPLPSSTFSCRSRYQQSASQERLNIVPGDSIIDFPSTAPLFQSGYGLQPLPTFTMLRSNLDTLQSQLCGTIIIYTTKVYVDR